LQLILILATIIAKPLSLTKTCLSCLQISIISKVLVWSMLIQNCQTCIQKMVTKSKILGFYPIDIYCAWPFNMAQ
jgi:hypothetical protein